MDQFNNQISEERAAQPTPRKQFQQVLPSAYQFDRHDPILQQREEQWKNFLRSQSRQGTNAGSKQSKRVAGIISPALLSPTSTLSPRESIMSNDFKNNQCQVDFKGPRIHEKRSNTTKYTSRIAAAKARSVTRRRRDLISINDGDIGIMTPPSTAAGINTVISYSRHRKPQFDSIMSENKGMTSLLSQDAHQIYNDKRVKNKALAIAQTLQNKWQDMLPYGKFNINDRRNTVFTPSTTIMSPFTVSNQVIEGEFGPYPLANIKLVDTAENSTDQINTNASFDKDDDLRDFMTSTFHIQNHPQGQIQHVDKDIYEQENKAYNSSRKKRSNKRNKKQLGLPKEPKSIGSESSKVKVVVIDPSINVRDLQMSSNGEQSGERSRVGKTLESLNTKEGFYTKQSRDNAYNNIISMDNVMKNIITARNSKASKDEEDQIDMAQTPPLLLAPQMLGSHTNSTVKEGTCAFASGLSEQTGQSFYNEHSLQITGTRTVTHGYRANDPRISRPGHVFQASDQASPGLRAKNSKKTSRSKSPNQAQKSINLGLKIKKGGNKLQPLNVVKIPGAEKANSKVTLSPDISPKRLQETEKLNHEADYPAAQRSIHDSTALNGGVSQEQNSHAQNSNIKEQASRSNKGCSPFPTTNQSQLGEHSRPTGNNLDQTHPSIKTEDSFINAGKNKSSLFKRNNSTSTFKKDQCNDAIEEIDIQLPNAKQTLVIPDRGNELTEQDDLYGRTMRNSQEDGSSRQKAPTPIINSRMHHTISSMSQINEHQQIIQRDNLKSCGSKEQGENKRNILSPSVNNIQLSSAESGGQNSNQNYFKFGVRKSVSRGRNHFQKQGKSIKTINTLNQQRTSSRENHGSLEEKKAGEWKPLGMQPFQIDFQDRGDSFCGTQGFQSKSRDSNGNGSPVAQVARPNSRGGNQVQLNLNLDHKFQENRLHEHLNASKRIDEQSVEENSTSARITDQKAMVINDPSIIINNNHQSTFGKLKIDTEFSRSTRQRVVSRQAVESELLSPFSAYERDETNNDFPINAGVIKSPLLSVAQKSIYSTAGTQQASGNRSAHAQQRSKSNPKTLNSDLVTNNTGAFVGSKQKAQKGHKQASQALQVTDILKGAGLTGAQVQKAILTRRKLSHTYATNAQGTIKQMIKNHQTQNAYNPTFSSNQKDLSKNANTSGSKKEVDIVRNLILGEPTIPSRGWSAEKRQTNLFSQDKESLGNISIKGEFNIENLIDYDTVLSAKSGTNVLSTGDIQRVKEHGKMLIDEKLNLLSYASSIIDQEANQQLDQTIKEFRSYLQNGIAQYYDYMPNKAILMHTQTPQDKILSMTMNQNQYGILQQQNERKVNNFKQNQKKKSLEELSRRRTQVIDQDLMLKQNPATREDKKTSEVQKERILINIQRERALFVLSRVYLNTVKLRIQSKNQSSLFVSNPVTPGETCVTEGIEDALKCQNFSQNLQKELISADQEIKIQLDKLDDIMEQHKANQRFVIQDPPQSQVNTAQLMQSPPANMSPTSQDLDSDCDNKMKEIKMTPTSRSKYVKWQGRKPQNRMLTQIDLNKYSLKHQISFDKDLMKIQGVETRQISSQDKESLQQSVGNPPSNMCAAGMQTSIQLDSEATPRDQASSPGAFTSQGYSPMRPRDRQQIGIGPLLANRQGSSLCLADSSAPDKSALQQLSIHPQPFTADARKKAIVSINPAKLKIMKQESNNNPMQSPRID